MYGKLVKHFHLMCDVWLHYLVKFNKKPSYGYRIAGRILHYCIVSHS